MVTYRSFVQNLGAAPDVFVKTVESTSFNVLRNFHACIGLAGEVVELLDADDSDNFMEELGDVAFYSQFFTNTLNWRNPEELYSLELSRVYKYHSTMELIEEALVESHNLLDLHKKHFMYGQDFDFGLAHYHFERFYTIFLELLTNLGYDITEIQEVNTAKLNKRYKDGFSTQASIDRVDKNS